MQTEAVISIFLPALIDAKDDFSFYEEILQSQYDRPPFFYRISLEDTKEFAILASDRELTSEEARMFYQEITEYQQGFDLPEEKRFIRDAEVIAKWLNGNWNWWCLGAGTVDEQDELDAECGCETKCEFCECKK